MFGPNGNPGETVTPELNVYGNHLGANYDSISLGPETAFPTSSKADDHTVTTKAKCPNQKGWQGLTTEDIRGALMEKKQLKRKEYKNGGSLAYSGSRPDYLSPCGMA